MHNGQPARPTYSRLRTGILSITPGDKCRTYCKGAICKYCQPSTSTNNAILGLYSSWITENILAMARLPRTMEEILENFKRENIRTVVNLQESGEHAFCGRGVGPSGFSYDPELLMNNDIFYFNFPLPDFGGCSPARLLDICKAISSRLVVGKVAVHCHAGHGRTGMVIAAALMYEKRMTASEAVHLVRSNRAQAVQSADQVETLNLFETLLRAGGGDVVPVEKSVSCAEYITYSAKFLSKADLRLFGRVPCVVYVAVSTALRFGWTNVDIHFRPEHSGPRIFHVSCKEKIFPEFDAEEASLRLARGPVVALKEYKQMTAAGLSITNLQYFLQSMDLVAVIRFLHFFLQTSFHQLASNGQAQRFLNGFPDSSSEDWGQALSLLCWLCARLPSELLAPVSRLVSDAFVRGTELTGPLRRVAKELATEE